MIIKALSSNSNMNLAPIHQWNIPLETASDPITEELKLRYLFKGDDYVEVRCEKLFNNEDFIYTINYGYEDVFNLLKHVLKETVNRDEDWIADLIDKYKYELSKMKLILNSSELLKNHD